MAYRIESIFALLDQATGPARRIKAALDALDKSGKSRIKITEETTKATSRMFRITEDQARQALQWGQRIQTGQERIRHAHEQVASGVARASRAYGDLHGVMGRVFNLQNALIAGAAVVGTGLLGKSVLDNIGFMEQQRIAMTTILKDSGKADFTMRAAIRFADVTPFDTKDVLTSTKRALAMGFSRAEMGPLFQGTGNAAAAMGLSSADWTHMLTIFGQIRNAGQLYAQDAMQLTSLNLPVWRVLAKDLNKTVPEIKKMAENGKIGGDYVIKTLLRFFNSEYRGAMDRQSKSLFGLTSTLRSRMDSIWAGLEGNGALKPLNNFLMNLVQLSDFTKSPGSLIAKGFSAGMQNILESIFGPLDQLTKGVDGKLRMKRLIEDFQDFTVKLKTYVPIVKRNIRDFWEAFKAPFVEIKAFLQPVLGVVDQFSQSVTGSKVNWAKVAGGAAAFLLLAFSIRTVNGLLFGLPGLLLKSLSRGALVQFGGLGIRAATALKGGLLRAAGRSNFWAEIMTNPGGKLRGLGVAMWTSVKSGFGMMKTGFTTLFPGLAALGGRLATWAAGMKARLVGLWGSVLTGLRGLGGRVLGFFAALGARLFAPFRAVFARFAGGAALKMLGKGFLILLGPVGAVISAVWMVWDVLKMLWDNSPVFRNGVITIWDGIKQWFSKLPGHISTALGKVAEFMAYWFTKGKQYAVEKLHGIVDWFKNLPQSIATAMKNFSWASVGTAIKNGIKSALGWAGEVWDNIQAGWSKGVNTAEAEAAGAKLSSAAEKGTRTKAEIHSPSKLFSRLGGHVSEGFAAGITAEAGKAVNAMERAVDGTAEAARVAVPVTLAAVGALALAAPAMPAAADRAVAPAGVPVVAMQSAVPAGANPMGITIQNVQINVPAGVQNPERFGQQVARGFKESLAAELEQLALQVGYGGENG